MQRSLPRVIHLPNKATDVNRVPIYQQPKQYFMNQRRNPCLPRTWFLRKKNFALKNIKKISNFLKNAGAGSKRVPNKLFFKKMSINVHRLYLCTLYQTVEKILFRTPKNMIFIFHVSVSVYVKKLESSLHQSLSANIDILMGTACCKRHNFSYLDSALLQTPQLCALSQIYL